MSIRHFFFPVFLGTFLTGCTAFSSIVLATTDPELTQMVEVEDHTTPSSSTSEFHSLPYTPEEIDDIFGTLPRYFDLGSFTLNELNHIPIGHLTDKGMILSGKNTSYRLHVSWDSLKSDIERRLSDQQGDWAVYVKDLKTEDEMEINEHSMESASLIKLFIAGTTLEQIENHTLTETETISHALHEMITVSDNESSNVLVRSFLHEGEPFQKGLDIVNAFNEEYNFTNTIQVNGIADPSLWISDGRLNSTSPADCGHFLEMVYNGELVSHYDSFRLETLLNNQQVNYKIPAALPEGTHIAHKTGEVDDTENDVAIIYTPFGDYIFCIMSTDLYDTGAAVDKIHEITRVVYDWFTNPIIEVDPVTLEPIER